AVEFAAARTPLAELRKSLTSAQQASAPWPTWGLTPQRTRYAAGSTLRPPYRTLWTLHAGALIELPPALAYGRLYFGTHAGTFIAASAVTGAILWRRQLHHCMASTPTVASGVVYVALMGPAPCTPHQEGAAGGVIAL